MRLSVAQRIEIVMTVRYDGRVRFQQEVVELFNMKYSERHITVTFLLNDQENCQNCQILNPGVFYSIPGENKCRVGIIHNKILIRPYFYRYLEIHQIFLIPEWLFSNSNDWWQQQDRMHPHYAVLLKN